MKGLACACVLLSVVPTCQRDGTVTPESHETVQGGPLELSLVTYNIRYENPAETDWRGWPQRVSRLVTSLRRMNPDVFGLQECLHGQAADLRASLPDYDFHGVGRDDGRRTGEYAAIFFRRERFELTHSGHFWLSDQPDVPGSMSWGNSYPRMVSWVRLVDRHSGRGFSVYNTHWDHRNQYSRERSAPVMAGRMDSRPHPEEPLVLLGDFNAVEKNPAVEYFTGGRVTLAGKQQEWPTTLLDTFDALHRSVRNRRTLHFWQEHHRFMAKVDHILVSTGAEVVRSGIRMDANRMNEPSDHFPVWAEVRWP